MGSEMCIRDRDKVTPGTKMPIQKMKNKKDRLDLVLFLKEATK